MRVVRVYLIRHGETNWNKKHKIQGGGYDVPLNETGKEQALKSAKALEGILFDAVASLSPARAKETTDIVFDCISRRQTNAKQPLRIVDAGYNRTNNNRKATMENESKLDNEIDDPADKALVEHVNTYGDFHAESSANNNNNASSVLGDSHRGLSMLGDSYQGITVGSNTTEDFSNRCDLDLCTDDVITNGSVESDDSNRCDLDLCTDDVITNVSVESDDSNPCDLDLSESMGIENNNKINRPSRIMTSEARQAPTPPHPTLLQGSPRWVVQPNGNVRDNDAYDSIDTASRNTTSEASPHPSDLVPNSCIRPDDILFYTPGQSQRKGHYGNVEFRKLLASRLPEYHNSDKSGRSRLSGEMYKSTKAEGGRFLKQTKIVDQVHGEPLWKEMSSRKAREAIGSRFRQVRKQMNR